MPVSSKSDSYDFNVSSAKITDSYALASENATNFVTIANSIKNGSSADFTATSTATFDVATSQAVLISVTVIYAFIFVTGIIGNIITCVVISKNKSMHTSVNYYLFSLAISDLLLLVSAMPDEVYTLWTHEYPFNESACKIHRFASETFANATVLTITAFTIERYVAICKPFLSQTMSKFSRAYKFILLIWVVSMILAIPQTLMSLTIDFNMCMPRHDVFEHLFAVSTCIIFLIPMIIITVLYIMICIQLRRSKVVKRATISGSSVRLKHKIFKRTTKKTIVTVNLEGDSSQHYSENVCIQTNIHNKYQKNYVMEQESMSPDDGRINYSKKANSHGSRHVENMLIGVVIAFAICWLPFHVQRLASIYLEPNQVNQNLFYCVTYLSGIFYYTSTCINPFLYNIMSNKFREAFKNTIASYFYGSTSKLEMKGRLRRNISQRSNNSQSVNTCSSVCSAQNTAQPSFRYYEKPVKRPLVVSFRRIDNMGTSRSNLHIHRNAINMKNTYSNDNLHIISSIEIANPISSNRISQSNQICELYPNRSCRNFELLRNTNYHEQPDEYPTPTYSISHPTNSHKFPKDKYYPKEKYYGNALLSQTHRNTRGRPYSSQLEMKSSMDFDNVRFGSSYKIMKSVLSRIPKTEEPEVTTNAEQIVEEKKIDDTLDNLDESVTTDTQSTQTSDIVKLLPTADFKVAQKVGQGLGKATGDSMPSLLDVERGNVRDGAENAGKIRKSVSLLNLV